MHSLSWASNQLEMRELEIIPRLQMRNFSFKRGSECLVGTHLARVSALGTLLLSCSPNVIGQRALYSIIESSSGLQSDGWVTLKYQLLPSPLFLVSPALVELGYRPPTTTPFVQGSGEGLEVSLQGPSDPQHFVSLMGGRKLTAQVLPWYGHPCFF